jgi:hypothetical protein
MAAFPQQDCTVAMLPPCGRTVDASRRHYPCAPPDHESIAHAGHAGQLHELRASELPRAPRRRSGIRRSRVAAESDRARLFQEHFAPWSSVADLSSRDAINTRCIYLPARRTSTHMKFLVQWSLPQSNISSGGGAIPQGGRHAASGCDACRSLAWHERQRLRRGRND